VESLQRFRKLLLANSVAGGGDQVLRSRSMASDVLELRSQILKGLQHHIMRRRELCQSIERPLVIAALEIALRLFDDLTREPIVPGQSPKGVQPVVEGAELGRACEAVIGCRERVLSRVQLTALEEVFDVDCRGGELLLTALGPGLLANGLCTFTLDAIDFGPQLGKRAGDKIVGGTELLQPCQGRLASSCGDLSTRLLHGVARELLVLRLAPKTGQPIAERTEVGSAFEFLLRCRERLFGYVEITPPEKVFDRGFRGGKLALATLLGLG
jgi:hypothetical protein